MQSCTCEQGLSCAAPFLEPPWHAHLEDSHHALPAFPHVVQGLHHRPHERSCTSMSAARMAATQTWGQWVAAPALPGPSITPATSWAQQVARPVLIPMGSLHLLACHCLPSCTRLLSLGCCCVRITGQADQLYNLDMSALCCRHSTGSFAPILLVRRGHGGPGHAGRRVQIQHTDCYAAAINSYDKVVGTGQTCSWLSTPPASCVQCSRGHYK